MTENAKAEPDVIDMPPRHIAAIVRDFTMETRGEIPQLWNRYFELAPKPDNAVDGAMYGVSFAADGQGRFRYGVGVEVAPKPADLPGEMCTIELAKGTYAVFRRFGPVSDLPGVFDWVFSTWLPESGRSPVEGAVFERYPTDARNGPDGMAYEIWAPVSGD